MPSYGLHDAAGITSAWSSTLLRTSSPGDVFTLHDIHNDTAIPALSLMLRG